MDIEIIDFAGRTYDPEWFLRWSKFAKIPLFRKVREGLTKLSLRPSSGAGKSCRLVKLVVKCAPLANGSAETNK